MPTDNQEYGKPITRAAADIMFDRAKQIKQRSRRKIREALHGDPEAIRYYTGRPNPDNTLKEDDAFIFTKDAVELVVRRIKDDQADGVVLFNAARGALDSVGDDGEFTDFTGRPTLLMFPFKFTPSGSIERDGEDNIVILDGDGYQHPGTGGDDEDDNDNGGNGVQVQSTPVPSIIRRDQVHISPTGGND